MPLPMSLTPLYGWIEVWFQRGMKETPEEMAAMFPN